MPEALVKIEKFYDERLWVITITDGTWAGVDAWEATVRSYIAEVSPSTLRYLVYDTTTIPNLGFTKYLQERAAALARDNRDATGRVAIVAHLPPMVNRVLSAFINLTGSRIQPHLEVKMFTERQAAIEWVAKILPSSPEG